MTFPETERVIYRDNPLQQVICQLRFPTILRIDTESPADFQEHVRHLFPGFRETHDDTIHQLPDAISQSLPPDIASLISPKSNPRFQFVSKSGYWTIALTRDFVALDTRRYTRWEDFREFFKLALKSLKVVYSPPYFTRVGLRYRNVIDRKRIGLQNVEWRDLIEPFVLAQLAQSETMENVLEQQGKTLLQLNDSGDMVRMEYGQVTEKDGDPSNKLYLLDHDFYTNSEMETKDVIGRLDDYNSHNRRLFRWCIRERLHEGMGPEST